MGLTFEGETIEDGAIESGSGSGKGHKSSGRRHRKLKPYAIAIIIPVALLILICIGGVVVKYFFPEWSLGRREPNANSQFVADETGEYKEWTVMERVNSAADGGFTLQLPDGVTAGDIAIENHYRDRALLVRLSGVKAADFAGSYIAGDVSDISVVAWKAKDNEILVSFQMSEIWEYEVNQEGGRLIIRNSRVDTIYDTVVVIDPIYSADISVDITANIAELAATKAAEQGIKVYITRSVGTERSEAERLALILDTDADYVIELSVSSDSDNSKYGLSAGYNDKYYNPVCDNVTVADTVLKSVAASVKNRANNITAVHEDCLLMLVKQPSAEISVGYISNSDEYALLCNNEYCGAVAAGIIEGIKELALEEQ